MARREKRIKNLRRKIEALDRQIDAFTGGWRNRRWFLRPIANKIERLYDRRDKWEEHLMHAEMFS